MDRHELERQRPYRFALLGASLVTAFAWLFLWQYVVTPFEKGETLYYLGAGFGLIPLMLLVSLVFPSVWKSVVTRGSAAS